MSLPGCTWQCGLKYPRINLQTLQDKDLILTLENNIRSGFSAVMGDRYVNQMKKKDNLYGYYYIIWLFYESTFNL